MEGNKIKVSVIVPIYNVELYIERCARSLFEQTLEDIEFIFVNDCTPDKSIEILEKVIEDYPQRKQQIQIIYNDINKGPSPTRNKGLDAAKGEYIAYCDSDDWVEPTMYEELYKKAITENADIVWSDFIMNTKNGELYYKMMVPLDNKTDTIKQYLSFGWNVVVNMITKRELYYKNNIRWYEEFHFTEDYGLAIKLIFYAKKIKYIEKAFYHYDRENQSSIVHQELDKDKRERMTNDEVSICCITNEFFIKEGVYGIFEKELSWRMLKAKRAWLYDFKHWGDYKRTYPESNKFYKTNPFVSEKDFLCQKLFSKSYTRPFILVVIILDKIYKRLKIK